LCELGALCRTQDIDVRVNIAEFFQNLLVRSPRGLLLNANMRLESLVFRYKAHMVLLQPTEAIVKAFVLQ
jgi:hypothetical protein